MSKQKITSFEELAEDVKKLYNSVLEVHNIGGTIDLRIEPMSIDDCLSTKWFKFTITLCSTDLYILEKYDIAYGHNGYATVAMSKNPQKIYDVIYAIKQCEVEDE